MGTRTGTGSGTGSGSGRRTGGVEQVTDAIGFHAEGPVWSPAWGGLRWVDMYAGDLLTLRADGRVDRLHVGSLAAFVRPRTRGGYVVGLQRGIGLADDVDAPPVALPELWSDEDVRMNEGGCDPAGTLYAGSMAVDGSDGRGTLWRIGADGAASPLLTGVSISNGLDISPDGTLAYYDDTATGGTDVLDVRDGTLVDRRPWWRGQDGERPDGLVVDAAGNVWVALNGAGAVRCLDPQGATLAEVELPARGVTACTLGGDDGRDLFVTTSREGLEDPEPGAGALFRARVEVPGRPVLPYGG